MSELTMDRLRENLESLKMKNTLEILDNYLERAVADKLNIVEVLDHIFAEEAKSKRKRAYEKQVQMSGFPIKKTLTTLIFPFSPPSTSARSMNWLPCAFWRTEKMWSFSDHPVWERPTWLPPSVWWLPSTDSPPTTSTATNSLNSLKGPL